MEEGEMRKVANLWVLGILIVLVGGPSARAQECPTSAVVYLGQTTCAQVQYHGGPILEHYTIYPLYYGNWTQEQIKTQQAFLQNLAAYISGENAPTGEQPTLWQYGPRHASVATAVWVDQTTSSNQYTSTCNRPSPGSQNSPGNLWDCDVQQIIKAHQGSEPNEVPDFGPEKVIFLFPAPGFTDTSCNCGGYHWSESDSAFYGAVFDEPPGGPYADADSYFQAVTSHEVFEDATDPATGNFWAWVSVPCQVSLPSTNPPTPCPSPSGDQIDLGNLDREVADQCATVVTLPDWPGGPLQFAAITDNTQDGACTTTGYMPLQEIAKYQLSQTQFETMNDIELAMNNQLYILQSYVLSDGNKYYDAVWRPQFSGTATATGGPATGLYQAQQLVDDAYPPGTPESGYKARFESLDGEGWRLYTLQTVFQNQSPQYYTAVWRRGTATVDTKEIGYFGTSLSQFLAEYQPNFKQPTQWRLYALQYSINSSDSDWTDAVFHQPDGPTYACADNVTASGPGYSCTATPCNCSDEVTAYASTLFGVAGEDIAYYYPEGYRLYIVDPFVLPFDGVVFYNVIWRKSTDDEDPFYGQTLGQYETDYANELNKGYYLHNLSVYVVSGVNGDQVFYDAVFRKGMLDRPL
jgi:hypothetical protein